MFFSLIINYDIKLITFSTLHIATHGHFCQFRHLLSWTFWHFVYMEISKFLTYFYNKDACVVDVDIWSVFRIKLHFHQIRIRGSGHEKSGSGSYLKYLLVTLKIKYQK